MNRNSTLITYKDLLCCPKCQTGVEPVHDELVCRGCQQHWKIIDSRPDFRTGDIPTSTDSILQQELMINSSWRTRILKTGQKLINSDYTPVNHLNNFISSLPPEAITAELGSGNRRLLPQIINVDISPFPNVDILANIQQPPFFPASFDAVIMDTVLEHVPEPHTLVNAVHRILKPGGKVICISPFLFPYHGYPLHYNNFSRDGLKYLFRHFSDCTVEMNIGPTCALTHIISEYLALIFSAHNKLSYTVLKGFFLLPIFWLKYIDNFWRTSMTAHAISSHLCALAKK